MINVSFFIGSFIDLSVVSSIINDMFGIFVIFLDVIIKINISEICCVMFILILYICVIKIVVSV